MKSKTHIIILHMKEILYTAIFAVLAILLLILLIYMFGRKNNTETMTGVSQFNPGIYTSTLILGDQQVEVSVTVSENGLIDADLKDLDENITAMYPLLETCMNDISKQLQDGTPLNQISYSDANQYTVSILTEAINNALQKAAP